MPHCMKWSRAHTATRRPSSSSALVATVVPIFTAAITPSGIGSPSRRPRPVSYTHLDVYKRQAQEWEAYPGFAEAHLGELRAILDAEDPGYAH